MVNREPSRTVVDIVTGTWRAQALCAAAALHLPDHVAAGHRTIADLAARAGADPDGIGRLMRLLSALGIFAGDEATGYTATPVSDLLRADVPGSMRDMCLLYGEEFHQAWGRVEWAVRTGRPGFDRAFGRTLHEHLAQVDGAGARFLNAMNAGSPFFVDVPKVFDFTGFRTITDVAGGSGLLLSTILAACPHTRGVVFDREHMIPIARAHLSEVVEDDRFDVVGGDVFDSVPRGSDVYLLSRVLQDWDDSACRTILANIRAAMADKSARVLILERVIDGDRELPLLYDLHLHVMAGGRERTLPGYSAVLADAGLRLEAVHDLALETSLLVARPE